MTYDITRARAIQLWFVAVAVIAGIWLSFGSWPGVVTAAMLAGLSAVPAGILMLLWPGSQPVSARELMRETKSL
jgi:hypothetical protein